MFLLIWLDIPENMCYTFPRTFLWERKQIRMEIKEVTRLSQWMRMYPLYRTAFPKAERKPFWMIRRKKKLGESDVWYFEEDGKFKGLATTVNDAGGKILLDYFAVTGKDRGKGNGGKMLKLILKQYEGRDLFGEIELADENAANNAERVRRKAFYLRNGLVALGVKVNLFGVDMELLSNGCQVTFEEYHAFYCRNIGEFARDNVVELK